MGLDTFLRGGCRGFMTAIGHCRFNESKWLREFHSHDSRGRVKDVLNVVLSNALCWRKMQER
jgi:hypothetical protein